MKIQTWFPLTMQVYVNGHDYLAKKLDELGVKYGMYDNAFTWIEDMQAAQKRADEVRQVELAEVARSSWPATSIR